MRPSFLKKLLGFAQSLAQSPASRWWVPILFLQLVFIPALAHGEAALPFQSIAISPSSGDTLRFSAQQLQEYLEQMTGVRLEVVERLEPSSLSGLVLVPGASPAMVVLPETTVWPDPGTDAFALESYPSGLAIVGGSERAVLFGVYDLLERLGCRWLGPGEDFVPRVESLSVPAFHLFEKPSLRWRALELIAGITPEMVDWMAKAKLNVVWPESYVPKEDLSADEKGMEDSAIAEIRKRGLSVFWGGHVLPQMFPASRYGEEHPEYFALIDGKRLDPEGETAARWQLCTSHPEVMRLLCENAVQFLKNHPWIEVLFLWGNDTVRWCECDNCRALEPQPDLVSPFGGLNRSVSYCRMVRAVEEAVAAALPGRRIAFNHYYNLEELPLDASGQVLTSVLPGSGSLSAVDDYHQCDRHAFADSSCPRGKRIRPIAEMWRPYTQEAVGWTYYFAWNFTLGLPVGMGDKMVSDFQHFRDLGLAGVVDNVSLHPDSLQSMNNRLNYYLFAKAAWDANLNKSSAQKEFIDHYYGPAREAMGSFWEISEQTWTRFGLESGFMPEDTRLSDPASLHGRLIDAWDPVLKEGETRSTDPRFFVPNPAVRERMTALLTQAQEQAGGDPLLSFRIGLLQAIVEKGDAGRKPPYRIVGFLNGGGNLTNYLYRGSKEITCTVSGGGGGEGDCFPLGEPGVEVLSQAGDAFEVEARINLGAEAIGEPTYRSGPGIYQAQDENTPCGQEGNSSVMLFIGNVDSETSGARRVIAILSDGRFQTEILSSSDGVWNYREFVRLRVENLGPTEKGHAYAYSYQSGDQWVEIGRHTFTAKLPFAAPMHRWAGYQKGALARFPLLDWADIRLVEGRL